MTEPRRHHWVPRFYLKNFAIPETVNSKSPKVWALHRHKGEEMPMSITNVGVQKDLYTLSTPDGQRDLKMEHELSKIESVVADACFWPVLSNDFIDLDHLPNRRLIALFLATLFLRSPARLTQNIDLHRKIVQLVESAPKDSDGRPPLREIAIGRQGIRFDYDEWEEYRCQTDEEIRGIFVHSIKRSAGWIADKLLAKRWSILFVDQPLFVTSTSPLVVLNPELKPFQILGPNSTLMWPISPTRILCLDELHEPANRYYPLKELKAVGMYTYLSWVNTDHFLVSPRPIPAVLQEMMDYMEAERERQESQLVRASASENGKDDTLPQHKTKVGRNDLCPCGSGKKYKKCCGR